MEASVNPIVTAHWSATGPEHVVFEASGQPAYHVQLALAGNQEASWLKQFQVDDVAHVDFGALRRTFNLWKCLPLGVATAYGTWHWNHNPEDGVSPNIEVGALCMGGERVGLTSWGAYPFTKAHAWMMAAVIARICILKKIDAGRQLVGVHGMQNPPFYAVSTHGERAFQTPDSDATLRPGYGDFAYGGDPECRWDLAALDPSECSALATPQGAVASMCASAKWLRDQVHAIKLAGVTDFWGLDK